MGSIRIKDLREDEAIEGGPEKDYPAMLIGNMGVDKKFRSKGLGSFIYEFCVGLARRLSKELDADMCICIPIGTKWDFMGENVGLYHLKRSQTREGYGCIEG